MLLKPLPPVELLRQLLDYDGESGALTWRERPREFFKTARSHSVWNVRYAGKPAITQVGQRGYARGKFLGGSYSAHRIAWKMAHGTEPNVIDHINGDKTDNRAVNLRSVTWAENTKNRPLPRNNRSGVAGVFWCNTNRKWVCQISAGKRRRHLGMFDDKRDAVACRRKAEVDLGFHENHGRKPRDA